MDAQREGRLLQLVYYLYLAGSALARLLPETLAYGLTERAAWLVARRSKKRPIVERNLARITGQPEGSEHVQLLATDAFKSYARYWLETFRLVREEREYFLDRFHCAGEHNLDEVLARGRGALVVVGHLGNWDAAGAWCAASGRRVVTVAEVLRPRRMYDFFVDHRARLGIEIYPARPGVSADLLGALGEGAVVAILGDRDLRGTGPEVSFFGERATFPAGPASIALRSRLPVIVAGVYGTRLDDGRRGWLCQMSEPLELESASDDPGSVARLTQRIASQLEGFVARRPEEWHVFQPFWLSDKTPR